MIEELYAQVIYKLRQYVNSIDRKESTKVKVIEDFLENIIKRIEFVSKNDHNKVLEDRLIRELKKLSKSLFIKVNNDGIYKEKMQKNIDRLAWINLKHKINTSGRIYTVAQREIFYANLGENIGSEQNGRRPVIILQNNTGNRKGNTTIIAPVTTHQKRALKYDVEKKMYYIERLQDGIMKRKYLGQYEIPLKLEGKETGLYGFINVMHMREIDRKRIDSQKVGVATEKCFEQVIRAINRNLQA
ncbi:MAG: type II toxin-antitoxin system PemK/MazF family toxin [Lachnospiraceae bacterium]|nr:type II toxin-antitoxin system PemK/MazF family toxin [Lachnospiraceae bacterium]